MLYAAVGIFAVSAVIGLVLATKHFKGQPVAIPTALVHGGLSASALVIFALAAVRAGLTPLSKLSLSLFVVAALGGFVLFGFHLKGRALPKGLILVHALVAVSAFLMLLAFVFAAAAPVAAPAAY